MIETALERPLKILHVVTAEESPALALIENLAKLGHRQTLLAPTGASIGVDVDVQPLTLPALGRLSAEFDLVHAHDTQAHSMAAATARVRVIASRRAASAIQRGPGFRWKYRRTARFIAVSRYVERLLLDVAIPAERIAVVYDGVGMAEPSAGDASLVLALESSPILAGTEAVVAISRNLAADLPCARVFLYIATAESSLLPVLQAMAHGVPVIASRVGGLPEVVEDRYTGILVSNDAQSVADALARVLEHPEFGANARARVAERFRVDVMVRGTLAVYREVLAPAQSSSS
jgi:hypothetical protein